MSRLSPVLFLALFLAGCETINEARRAQDPANRAPGERTVSAKEMGLDAGTTLTLDQGVRVALTANPQVSAARSRVEQARANADLADTAWYPHVGVSADYRWSRSGGAGTLRPRGDTIGNTRIAQSAGAGLSVSQLIWDFGRADASRRQAYSNFLAAQADLAAVENDTVYGFKQSFFTVLRQEELVRVGEETVRQFEKRLEQVDGFVKVGTRQKYDLTKAQVDLGNAQLTLVKARTALSFARAALNSALGFAEEPLYQVDHPAASSSSALPFAEAVEAARVYHPRLHSALIRENAARYAIDGAIADFYPSIGLSASLSWAGSLTPFSWLAALGPSIDWTAYDGGARIAILQGAIAGLRETYAARALEEQQIYLDLRQAYSAMEDTRESLKIVSLTVQQATEQLELVAGRYRAGKASSVELTDAQVALATAKADEIRARYDFEIALVAIERSVGGLRKP